MNERMVIDGVIAYLEYRKENLEYMVERVAETEEDLEEIEDLKEMINGLKNLKESKRETDKGGYQDSGRNALQQTE